MRGEREYPDFIFESSWEVCNKVGGIYTVLSIRARTMRSLMGDRVAFVGPDLWEGRDNPLFAEDSGLWAGWVEAARAEGLRVRAGRWLVPGEPGVILVDFKPFFAVRNDIYASAWENFGVDSLHGYGDYDEASMFSYAAGRVVESFWRHSLQGMDDVVFQAHEWMTGLGLLYVRKHAPRVATVFTTHATSIGRSIAGNGKPLYDRLGAYDGDQMARELNMEAKHSVERQAARHADCFSTVSDVTARECAQLLGKPCDAVLPNGFEPGFVPQGARLTAARRAARRRILEVANALTGRAFPEDTLIVATSGRYEYKNKGIDVFLEAMYHSLYDERLTRPALALVQVPAWVDGPRADLRDRLERGGEWDTPLPDPFVTHQLREPWGDRVLDFLRSHGMRNDAESRVKVVFAPCYLDGADGVFNMTYYDLLPGDDLAVYPSYYEPWGYTPLEAAAFHVPCLTTTLSGFGAWADKVKGAPSLLEDGAEVVPRTDYNHDEVARAVSDCLARLCAMRSVARTNARRGAARLAARAEWGRFIKHYADAYRVALDRRDGRVAAR